MRKIGCQLVRCDPTQDETACGLLQMKHTVPPPILYNAYWYRSGTNNTMRTHLKGIADTSVQLLAKSNALVLDIGCNDGTLLKAFPTDFIKYGVDPSDVAQEVVGENISVVQDIFPSPQLNNLLEGRKLDLVTSIAMFYDLEDPVGFCRNIRDVLSDDGIWIFEMSYMPTMLERNMYDTICHEHLEYYSFAVIEKVLARADLHVFRVEFNEINGGSVRCFATHRQNTKYITPSDQQRISRVRQDEFDMALDTDAPYKEFQARIEIETKALKKLLTDLKSEGNKIHIYGASTKGNTILQFCGIDSDLIDCAAERNPDKYGARTLGTNIPIVSEADSRAMKPDYYLVLPWHFKQEFIEREKATLDSGVGFIFPLPTIEILKGQVAK